MRKLLALLVFALLLQSALIATMPVKAVTLNDGLVLYLPMDEGYGSTVSDASGNGNNGVIYGNATWVNGKYGKALSFDGVNDYVATTSFSLAPNTFTFSAWVYLDVVAGTHQVVGTESYSSQGYFHIYCEDGELVVGYYSGGWKYVSFNNFFSSGVWIHMVVMEDFGNLSVEVYQNGVFFGEEAMLSGAVFPGWNCSKLLGSYSIVGPSWFNGVIDEIRLYNRALSAAEVSELYAYSPYQTPSTFNEKTAIYADGTTLTVNNVTGYHLTTTASTAASVTASTVGSETTSWGWRIYLRYPTGATELTAGTPDAVVTRSSDGVGLQSNTFTLPQDVNLEMGYTALMLVLYQRFGTGDWTAKAIFITDLLFYPKITASTWTLQLYTNHTEAGGVTYASAWWGNSTYATGVSDIMYKQPDQFDWMSYHMHNGDPFNLVVAPFTYLIGNLFYALVGFAVCGTIYVRYRNAGVVLVLLVLFGGAGGIANLMFGDVVLGLVWLLATFGFAALFYKVFR